MTTTKIRSLNTESGGRLGFDRYIKKEIRKADYWAFQEVHARQSRFDGKQRMMPADPGRRKHPPNLDLASELCLLASRNQFLPIYAPQLEGFHDLEPRNGVRYGQLTAVSISTFELIEFRNRPIYRNYNHFNTERIGGNPCGKVATGVLLREKVTAQEMVVINVHGFWSRYGKVDLPERLEQNRGINDLAEQLLERSNDENVLVIGDLNYQSNMQCLTDLRMQPCFDRKGVNLNHQFDIKRTRTDHYEQHASVPEADFAIASPGLAGKVLSMSVDLSVPSDHGTLEVVINW